VGDEFYYRGGTVQRFEGGLVVVDGAGQGRFVPTADGAAAVDLTAPDSTAPDPGIPDQVRAAFRSTVSALPLGAAEAEPGAEQGAEVPAGVLAGLKQLAPDAGVVFIDFSEGTVREIPGLGGVSLYLQSFNRGTAFLVLVDSPVLPFRARLLTGPFLDALLTAQTAPLPGTPDEAGTPSFQGTDTDPFLKALLEGFALYGLPLGDPLPRGAGEAQRFSRGWMLRR
jgi:hypothetical protein